MDILKNKKINIGDRVKHRGRRTLAAILWGFKAKISGKVTEIMLEADGNNSGIYKVEWRIMPVGRIIRFNELIAGSDLSLEK